MNTSTHSALQITHLYNMSYNMNDSQRTNETTYDFHQENQIVAITCVCLSLIACVATLCAYIASRKGQPTKSYSRREVWESTLMWIFANFVFSIIFRDCLIFAVLVIPSYITNATLAVNVYSLQLSYFWMFVQCLFLYLTYCHYDGLYNKVMNPDHLTRKKVSIFITTWLIPAALVIAWVIIHIVNEADQFDRTFRNTSGWTCIVGPVYFILGVNFLMMISVVYSYSRIRCMKMKIKYRKVLACEIFEKLYFRCRKQENKESSETDISENTKRDNDKIHIPTPLCQTNNTPSTCRTDSPMPICVRNIPTICENDIPMSICNTDIQTTFRKTFNPHARIKPKDNADYKDQTTSKQDKCVCHPVVRLLCLELVWIMIGLIMLSGLFGFVAVISVVINLIENVDQHLTGIVQVINVVFSFSQGFIVATIFAWTDRKIRHFAKKGLSEREARQRASVNEFTSSSQRSSVSSHNRSSTSNRSLSWTSLKYSLPRTSQSLSSGHSSFDSLKKNNSFSSQLATTGTKSPSLFEPQIEDPSQQHSLNQASQDSSNSLTYSSVNECGRSQSINSIINKTTVLADIHEEPLETESFLKIPEPQYLKRSTSLPSTIICAPDASGTTSSIQNWLPFHRKSSGYSSMGEVSPRGSLELTTSSIDTSIRPSSRFEDSEDLVKHQETVTESLLELETAL